MKCIACECAETFRRPDEAFLAGIAFAGSFNAQAMRERLCAPHLSKLQAGWEAALPAVPDGARRR